MGERAHPMVRLGLRGRLPISVRACNLTDSSIVLMTDELDFQNRAALDVSGVELEGVCAFAAVMPMPFAVVAFHSTPEQARKLKELERSFPTFEETPLEYDDHTARDRDPELTERDDTEKHEVVRQRPPISSRPERATIPMEPPDTEMPSKTPVEMMQIPSEVPIENALDKVLDQPTTEDKRPTFPELSKDGAQVWFKSREDFREQFAQNLVRGTIIVRTGPLQVGSRRTLQLMVPGARSRCSLPCVVAFNGKGVVGFVIDEAIVPKSTLRALREELEA